MKKTISLAALAVSASSSFAIVGPPSDTVSKTYCLSVYTSRSGSMMAGSCDQKQNNLESGVLLGENGCAQGQVSLTSTRRSGDDYPIKIRPCLPPNVVQL